MTIVALYDQLCMIVGFHGLIEAAELFKYLAFSFQTQNLEIGNMIIVSLKSLPFIFGECRVFKSFHHKIENALSHRESPFGII